MAKSDSKSKGVAFAKRAKISKAQQMMMMAIGATAMVFGITVVGVIYFVKVIRFNVTIIDENEKSISGFKRVQDNLRTIASKVGVLASSENLEVMANNRLGDECKEFRTEGFEYGLSNINTARTCSALRVIPDALPSSMNKEATTSSLNYLLNESGANIEGITFKNYSDLSFAAVTDSYGNIDTANTITAEVSELGITLKDSSQSIRKMLDIVENSIRNYDVFSITMKYGEAGDIELSGSYTAYYSAPKTIELKTKQVCANIKSTKCTTGKSN